MNTPIEASTLQRMTKAELIRLCQLQNKANHHVAAENVRLTNAVKFADQSKSVTIKELEADLATAHRGLAAKRKIIEGLQSCGQ